MRRPTSELSPPLSIFKPAQCWRVLIWHHRATREVVLYSAAMLIG